MTALPVLFSTTKSIYSTLPPIYDGSPVSVVAGNKYSYAGSIWEALTSGTVNQYPDSIAYIGFIAVAHEDPEVYPTLSVSGVSFKDITGHPYRGWSYAAHSYRDLLRVTNPNMISSLSPQRPTLANNTILFDSTSVIRTLRTDGFNQTGSGLCMWGYYDFSNEVASGKVSGVSQSIFLPLPKPSDSISWISVDADSPTYIAKRGATLQFATSTNVSPMFIGGMGYVEGFILDVMAPTMFSGSTRTLCYMWFHDCDVRVRGELTTALLGRANVIGRSVTNESLYIDVFFSDTNVSVEVGGSFSVSGRFGFECCSFKGVQNSPLLRVLAGVTDIVFTGSDFSLVDSSTPILTIPTTCPSLHAKFDNCVGLKSAQLQSLVAKPGTSYRVEIIGGWLDGEYDPDRYLAFTENYTLQVATDVYAYSSPSAATGGLTSLRYATTAWIEPGFSFCILHKFSSWSKAGVVQISAEILLPEGVVPEVESLWVDIGVCGKQTVELWSSRIAETAFYQDTETVWVNSTGYQAYRCTFTTVHAIDGPITGTLYCAIPEAVIYVRPDLDVVILGTF